MFTEEMNESHGGEASCMYKVPQFRVEVYFSLIIEEHYFQPPKYCLLLLHVHRRAQCFNVCYHTVRCRRSSFGLCGPPLLSVHRPSWVLAQFHFGRAIISITSWIPDLIRSCSFGYTVYEAYGNIARSMARSAVQNLFIDLCVVVKASTPFATAERTGCKLFVWDIVTLLLKT